MSFSTPSITITGPALGPPHCPTPTQPPTVARLKFSTLLTDLPLRPANHFKPQDLASATSSSPLVDTTPPRPRKPRNVCFQCGKPGGNLGRLLQGGKEAGRRNGYFCCAECEVNLRAEIE